MEDTVYFGTMLMLVGMATVFVILALVVLGGKLMIIIINKYAPLEESVVVRTLSSAGIETSKIAAITAAVETLTHGRGQITDIKRIEK